VRAKQEMAAAVLDGWRSVAEVSAAYGTPGNTCHAAVVEMADPVLAQQLTPIRVLGIDETRCGKPKWETGLKAMRRIVLLQLIRIILPPTGNETTSMLTTTSLLAIVSIYELFGTAQNIYGSNYQQVPLLVVASLWYLLLTSLMSIGQYFLEKRSGRGIIKIKRRKQQRPLRLPAQA
jgi:hypothetical protein